MSNLAKKFWYDFMWGFCIVIFVTMVPPIGTILQMKFAIPDHTMSFILFLSLIGIFYSHILMVRYDRLVNSETP